MAYSSYCTQSLVSFANMNGNYSLFDFFSASAVNVNVHLGPRHCNTLIDTVIRTSPYAK